MILSDFQPLGRNIEAWAWLSDIDVRDPDWLAVKAVSGFAAAPSGDTLASALECIGAAGVEVVPAAAPWPLVACIRFAERQAALDSETSVAEWLSRLALDAKAGDLGDVDAWVAAQERWSGPISVTEDFVEESSRRASSLPLEPGLGEEGYAPIAYSYSVHSFGDEPDGEAALALIRRLVEKANAEPVWKELAFFLAGVSEGNDRSVDRHVVDELFNLLAGQSGSDDLHSIWISWIGRITQQSLVNHLPALSCVGSVSRPCSWSQSSPTRC